MHVNELLTFEKQFRQTQNKGAHVFKPFSIPVPNEPGLDMKGVWVERSDRFRGYRENEKMTKNQVVIHYTVGHIRSDIVTLTPPRPAGYPENKNRFSVPFVIARDGTIYNLFHSGTWSYHLGRGTIGLGNGVLSRASIGIELSNYGPLKMSPDRKSLETAYSRVLDKKTGKRSPVDVYCSIEDKDKYIHLEKAYRGFQYFATCSDAQYESLIILCRYLTAVYDIPRKFLDESQRYEATVANTEFKGITSHVNYRPSGKSDMGPAFDWDRLIKGVQAARHSASGRRPAGVGSAGAAALLGLARASVQGNFQKFNNEDDMNKAFETTDPKLGGGPVVRSRSLGPDPEEDMEVEAGMDPLALESWD